MDKITKYLLITLGIIIAVGLLKNYSGFWIFGQQFTTKTKWQVVLYSDFTRTFYDWVRVPDYEFLIIGYDGKYCGFYSDERGDCWDLFKDKYCRIEGTPYWNGDTKWQFNQPVYWEANAIIYRDDRSRHYYVSCNFDLNNVKIKPGTIITGTSWNGNPIYVVCDTEPNTCLNYIKDKNGLIKNFVISLNPLVCKAGYQLDYKDRGNGWYEIACVPLPTTTTVQPTTTTLPPEQQPQPTFDYRLIPIVIALILLVVISFLLLLKKR